MTIADFLDLVPWAEMHLDPAHQVRHRTTLRCPIAVVATDADAETNPVPSGVRLGLTRTDAETIVSAADTVAPRTGRIVALHHDMVERMARVRPV